MKTELIGTSMVLVLVLAKIYQLIWQIMQTNMIVFIEMVAILAAIETDYHGLLILLYQAGGMIFSHYL